MAENTVNLSEENFMKIERAYVTFRKEVGKVAMETDMNPYVLLLAILKTNEEREEKRMEEAAKSFATVKSLLDALGVTEGDLDELIKKGLE